MKILFFSPSSGVWEFAALEGRIAASMRAEGHEVTFVTCGGALKRHCVVMAARALPPDATDEQRERICTDCRLHADILRDELSLQGPQLTALLDANVRDETSRLVDSLDLTSALALVVDGVPVGRRALYPFLAYKKKDTLDLSGPDLAQYRDQLFNTILAVRATRILIDRFRPDAVVSYSSTYSIVAACQEVARLNGVKDYFVEASGGMGSRHYRAILARGGIAAWYDALREQWKRIAHLPANPVHMRLVTDHMLHLFGAQSIFVYSASATTGNFDVREKMNFRPGQKLLLATMSSYDEWFAAEEAGLMPMHQSLFETQIEWVQALFEILNRRPDLFLVLRVHPREFPNRRESVVSAHSQRLAKIFKVIPQNCFINWPDQNISLYDLAKCTDVVLNAWSSAGKELTLLGLPVVEWAPDVLLYPPDERYVALQKDEYEGCIDRALGDGWSVHRILRMYRWCALEYGAATFETAEPSIMAYRKRTLLDRILGYVRRRLLPHAAERAVLRSALSPAAGRQLSQTMSEGLPILNARDAEVVTEPAAAMFDTEKQALAREIRCLADGLFGGEEHPAGTLRNALVGFSRQMEKSDPRTNTAEMEKAL